MFRRGSFLEEDLSEPTNFHLVMVIFTVKILQPFIDVQIPLETGYNFLGWFAGHHWAIRYRDIIYEIG